MKRVSCSKSYNFVLAGNPNVGKSTIFNKLTGLNQHTGNWTGKTVEVSEGVFKHKGNKHSITDLPGTYSLSAESEEEQIATDYIENGNYDCIIIVADSSALDRNLQLVINVLSKTSKAVLCLNMSDIARKNKITVDTDELSLMLGIPVVSVTAKSKQDILNLIDCAERVADGSKKTYKVKRFEDININTVSKLSTEISRCCVKKEGPLKISLADKIFSGKITGVIAILLILLALFWLTAYGANYPSAVLSKMFSWLIAAIKRFLQLLSFPGIVIEFICSGMLTTAAWVVSVMLPPAVIFFPLFSLLENWGVLPRIAFNLDGIFSRCGVSGRQSLTMLMGFGCNSCGVMGCRIIPGRFERNAAVITNSFIPCNGRLPMLISLSMLFFASNNSSFTGSLITAVVLLGLLVTAVLMTLLMCKIMSLISKDTSDVFVMEMPCFKKPDIIKTIAITFKDKVLAVLLRAVAVALPAGGLIWLIANIEINNASILCYITNFLEPVGSLIGVDGVIINSYLLGFPANEIVIPITIMSYTEASQLVDYTSLTELGVLLRNNNWNQVTALCTMILCLFHFPCSTTLISIYKETKSKVLTFLSFAVPLIIGFVLCGLVNLVYHIFF